MAKFSGIIGYALPVETTPGSWMDGIVEKPYRGDIITDRVSIQQSDQANDNILMNNTFSIVANAYAYTNIGVMKYIVAHGVAWKIQSFTINRPRIIIQIGGVYNGERPSPSP